MNGPAERVGTENSGPAGYDVRLASPDAIAAAAEELRAGGLVAFPTETVYGLGADATQGEAVARIYEVKGRPRFNPLIAHVADLESARTLAQFDARADALAQAFWPGPLTLVLPKARDCPVSELATCGLPTVAVRVPRHPVARKILKALGRPVVAPSANRSGHVSPTRAAHVAADLGARIKLILDGGDCEVGIESTIVACMDKAVLLRPGGIAREDIARALGEDVPEHSSSTPDQPLAPGMLASHYAPRARLRLNAEFVNTGEAVLAFGAADLPGIESARAVLNLSRQGNLAEAAANLFGHLRALDDSGADIVAVMPIPAPGLGEAINDRLQRAAAPRH